MGYPGSTSILRGFRISVATLDAFLLANGVEDTYGAPPFYQDHPDKDAISKLLYSKITKAGGTADKMNFRVMMPLRESMDYSTVAYVTYAWVSIFAHREILPDEDLPSEVPKGFEELRQEILSFGDQVEDGYKIANDGKMGLFAVYTYEIRGLYSPQELQERHKASPPISPYLIVQH
ncbi:hypothetical protein FALBO_10905 [Fusarium albosuccineum]|uniref:Uncharacterized protein n=1 Tax=Fusarium albosuccineum TaxID=1237068 RepID=A0A8H4P9D6_9HYPO|nr:hypothetical protein FALBO_10905 [Fusarium albosuccineum]